MSYSFQREYILKAQSPLIHFQSDMQGATLRATEVKPKLDRYIKSRLKRENRQLSDDWIIKNSPKEALNYKMQIVKKGNAQPFDMGMTEWINNRNVKIYGIFYGNTGVNDESKKKKGIKADCKLTITCFIEELRDYIDNIIGDFFVVTNFGTMQNKGFGSFTVANKNVDIVETLMNYYNAEHCYYFGVNVQNVFLRINTVYSLMKSGINQSAGKGIGNGSNYIPSFLFKYMLENSILHEKAKLKSSGIAPAVKKQGTVINSKNRRVGKFVRDNETIGSHNVRFRYVRALFGIGENIRFNDVNKPNNDVPSVNVSIVHNYECDGLDKKEKIERFPSSIFFKIIDNTVYYVAVPIDESIYGRTFRFSARGRGSVNIKVPEKDELSNNFQDEFLEYAYGRLNDCIRNRTGENALEWLRGMQLRKVERASD